MGMHIKHTFYSPLSKPQVMSLALPGELHQHRVYAQETWWRKRRSLPYPGESRTPVLCVTTVLSFVWVNECYIDWVPFFPPFFLGDIENV